MSPSKNCAEAPVKFYFLVNIIIIAEPRPASIECNVQSQVYLHIHAVVPEQGRDMYKKVYLSLRMRLSVVLQVITPDFKSVVLFKFAHAPKSICISSSFKRMRKISRTTDLKTGVIEQSLSKLQLSEVEFCIYNICF